MSAYASTAVRAPVASEQERFLFTGKVFTLPGARFAYFGTKQEPRFFVRLGNMDASMDMLMLRSQFSVAPHSEDDRLINLAVKGLRYVPEIRPGDIIPSEILTGCASWKIHDRHKQIAERRLHVQILSWGSGKEMVLTDPEELGMFLGQLESKSKLREAFEKAAVALGGTRADCDSVLQKLDRLARELCYIEALRDRFAEVAAVRGKLDKLRSLYSSDSRLRDEVQRINLFHERAVAAYAKRFEEIDGQTSEIIGALKALDRQIEYIRKARDDLYAVVRDWEPVLTKWADTPLRRSRAQDQLLSETYRLLATRFASGRSVLKA